MVKYLLALLLSTLPVLAQLGPHSDPAFLGQFLSFGTVAENITNNLVVWFKLSEGIGTNVFDTMSNANMGTVTGAQVSWVPGPIANKLPYALNVGGDTSGVVVPANYYVRLTTNFTVTCWLKYTNTASTFSRYAFSKENPSYAYQYLINDSDTGQSSFTYFNSSESFGAKLPTRAWPNWFYWVWTYNHTNFSVVTYTNGNVMFSATSGHIYNYDDAKNLIIGNRYDRVAGWSGYVSDLRFYTNYIFDPIEVTYMYNSYYLGQPGHRPTQGEILAAQWYRKVVTAGGAAPSSGTTSNIAVFVDTLISSNIYTKMISVNVMAPDNLTAATIPIIANSGLSTWINNNFVSGDLTVNGLIGNASNKYLRTGVIPSSVYGSINDNGISIYCSVGSANGEEVGSVVNPTRRNDVYVNNASTTSYLCYNSTTGELDVAVPTTLGVGFYSCNRTSTNNQYIYAANSSFPFAQCAGPGGAPTGTLPNIEYYVFGQNSNGSLSTPSDKRISFVAFHNGLSSSEAQILYNAVQSLRTGFGGGFN